LEDSATRPLGQALCGSSPAHLLTCLKPCASLLVSAQIVAGCANFPRRVRFFLSPRRRSGERIEERGDPNLKRPTRLLSPALSSIGWRRGSVWLRLGRAAPYRRIASSRPLAGLSTLSFPTPCRLQIGDTADFKSALRSSQGTPSKSRRSARQLPCAWDAFKN
jgi:hypothetical protein